LILQYNYRMAEESATKAGLVRPRNPFEGNEVLWNEWEKQCIVPPVRIALVHLNKPYDLAQSAQIALSTSVGVPHVGFEMVGTTLDFSHEKIFSKVRSWNIPAKCLDAIPRRKNSLEHIKTQGFRLVGTVPSNGKNALDFEWQDDDVIVIGGANGLSRDDQRFLDETITIPSDLHFMTTTSVIPILTYQILGNRGLWHQNEKS